MPTETKIAVNWAKQQKNVVAIKGIDKHSLVHYTRKYFNDNDIEYETFSFEDLRPFL